MRKPISHLSLPGILFLVGCTVTPTPIVEPSPVPTERPTLAPTPEPTEMVDYCVDCHTDKEQLIAIADPIVVGESESSGVG